MGVCETLNPKGVGGCETLNPKRSEWLRGPGAPTIVGVVVVAAVAAVVVAETIVVAGGEVEEQESQCSTADLNGDFPSPDTGTLEGVCAEDPLEKS